MEADARHARWRSLCVDAMLKRFEESSEGGGGREGGREKERKKKTEKKKLRLLQTVLV